MRIYKQYLRDKNRNPIGLVVLDKEGNYGWSKLRKGDKFTKELANKIALNRYYHYQDGDNVPQVMPRDIEKLLIKLNIKLWK